MGRTTFQLDYQRPSPSKKLTFGFLGKHLREALNGEKNPGEEYDQDPNKLGQINAEL